MSDLKVLIHIETQISSACSLSSSEVTSLVSEHLKNNIPLFRNGYIDFSDDIYLSSQVDFIIVTDLKPADAAVSFWQAELAIHAYRLLDSEPEKDYLEGEEDLPACEQWELPNKHLSGLWESIIVEETIKDRLLGYCDTSIAFAEAGVDSNVISWNRMALLYGPPGTGKTTICKALAQKMYIRHCSRYSAGMLLEINSHSLFSKWFSESGKLVMKLFEHIHEIAEDPQCFVTVLIDEVESIVMARNSTARSNEPGDAVRVVNSVLTSLDSLRRKPNVLVLCTSNLVSGIDAAFQDRVDLQVYLGPPLLTARYAILHSCVMELMHRGLIKVRPCPAHLSHYTLTIPFFCSRHVKSLLMLCSPPIPIKRRWTAGMAWTALKFTSALASYQPRIPCRCSLNLPPKMAQMAMRGRRMAIAQTASAWTVCRLRSTEGLSMVGQARAAEAAQ